jgi:hypothetical protein
MRDQGPVPSFSTLGKPSGVGTKRGAVDKILNHGELEALEPMFGEKLAKGQD